MKNLLNIMNLVASSDTAVPVWVEKSFPIIKIVLASIICAIAVALIILSFCQKSEAEGGVNAVTGQADTFYNRNKGESLQGKIKKWTIALSVVILVLCVAFLVINTIYKGY